MKEQIIQINQSIEEKRKRLKEKSERYFASITIPSDAMSSQHHNTNRSCRKPPISYILYGVAGVAAITAIVSESKIPFLGIAAVSAFGGYRLSKLGSSNVTKPSSNSSLNINSLKNEIASKVLDSVKNITGEWENFMDLKQKEIQNIIASSVFDDNQKDVLFTKIYLYEVIDISIADFTSKVKSIEKVSDLKVQLNSYKSKLLSAIDVAVNNQIAKYNALFEYSCE